MPQVNLQIHGKPYAIDCDDGQEKRVLDLGKLLDGRVREIAGAGAAKTEPHLLVLAALVMADELYELRETANNLGRQLQQVQDAYEDVITAPAGAAMAVAQEPQRLSAEEEHEILAAIDHLAARIDTVADRLAKI
jgi:cell division protein ZapA